MKQKIRNQKGQVVLMVLLASALVLTLGLSASRITTTETKIDTDQELLKRAFNTAESGIDYYLATGDTNYSSTGSDGAAELQVTKLGEVKTLSFNTMSLVGSYEYFWLVNHDTSATGIGTEYYSTNTGTINICSINPNVSSSAMGSLKIDYFPKRDIMILLYFINKHGTKTLYFYRSYNFGDCSRTFRLS